MIFSLIKAPTNLINFKGSYRCECYEGFEPSRDGKECLDRRKGYCFRQLIGGMCSTASDDLNQVRQLYLVKGRLY